MLGDIAICENIYIACGYTDMRKSIDGLAAVVQQRTDEAGHHHCDETTVQVLKEEGKKPQTRSYMWLYRPGNDGKAPIILYDYQPSRNGDHAATYLEDFQGYVHY